MTKEQSAALLQAAPGDFLGQKLKLRQLPSGHRAGTDAVLLAAAAPSSVFGLALDIGAGSGAAGLAFAALRPEARFGLIENDCENAALARQNVVLNRFEARGAVYEADLFSPASLKAAGLGPGCAGLVLTNPPFLDPYKHRMSPDPGRRRAHCMPEAADLEALDTQAKAGDGLAAWIKASLALLGPKGIFIIIHRAEALGAILTQCSGRLGGLTVMPVYPEAGKQAIRVLVRGIKGSRAPLAIAPSLILHEARAFTEEAAALHSGLKMIIW